MANSQMRTQDLPVSSVVGTRVPPATPQVIHRPDEVPDRTQTVARKAQAAPVPPPSGKGLQPPRQPRQGHLRPTGPPLNGEQGGSLSSIRKRQKPLPGSVRKHRKRAGPPAGSTTVPRKHLRRKASITLQTRAILTDRGREPHGPPYPSGTPAQVHRMSEFMGNHPDPDPTGRRSAPARRRNDVVRISAIETTASWKELAPHRRRGVEGRNGIGVGLS